MNYAQDVTAIDNATNGFDLEYVTSLCSNYANEVDGRGSIPAMEAVFFS
jgi:hypothetical protein